VFVHLSWNSHSSNSESQTAATGILIVAAESIYEYMGRRATLTVVRQNVQSLRLQIRNFRGTPVKWFFPQGNFKSNIMAFSLLFRVGLTSVEC
jgi:hypothetical protein